MHFSSACISQQIDNPARSRTTNDRIIDHHNPFTFDNSANRTQLHFYTLLTQLLTRLNKCTSCVLVFDQAKLVRDTRLLGITDRRGDTGIRYTGDNIRINKRFLGHHLTHPFTCSMLVRTVQITVRARKVNVLHRT
ncbi:hypothetical protein D1872_268550 [compost metagenome]